MKRFIAVMLFFFSINVCFAEEVIDLETFEVSSCIEIIEAINSEENNVVIELNSDIFMDQVITIPANKNVTIKGNGFSFLRLGTHASSFFNISKDAILCATELVVLVKPFYIG